MRNPTYVYRQCRALPVGLTPTRLFLTFAQWLVAGPCDQLVPVCFKRDCRGHGSRIASGLILLGCLLPFCPVGFHSRGLRLAGGNATRVVGLGQRWSEI